MNQSPALRVAGHIKRLIKFAAYGYNLTKKKGVAINSSQKILLGLAAAGLALLLLFPPFDQYSIANSRVPIFAGFYLFSAPPQYGVVNAPLLLLEVFVVLINAGIAWLLLQARPAPAAPARRTGYRNAVLLFAGVNLVVILLFPPFESVFSLTNAALPTFEGFYFVFDRRPNHTIVATLLYLEVIFILVNAAIAWLIFRSRGPDQLSASDAHALALELRARRS